MPIQAIIALVLFLVFHWSNVRAGDFELVLHGASVHFTQRSLTPWNEANDGFGLRYSFNHDLAVQVGHYRNSQTTPNFNFFTNYGIVDYTPYHLSSLSFGGFAGVASGYDEYYYWCDSKGSHTLLFKERPLMPAAGLLTRFQLNPVFSVTARLIPDAVAIEVGISFH